MGTRTSYSELLFAQPSFLEGVARVLDFGGAMTAYNEIEDPDQADALALASDWRAVGDDLWSAIGMLDARYPTQRSQPLTVTSQGGILRPEAGDVNSDCSGGTP